MFTVHIWDQWGRLHMVNRYATRAQALRRLDVVNSLCRSYTATLEG